MHLVYYMMLMHALWLNQYKYRLPDWLIDSSCAWILNKSVWEAATICPRPCKLTFDILILKVVVESRDVGYLCANFSLLGLSFYWFRPDVRDRQTSDVRQMPSWLIYRYYWYLVILYFNYFQEMYFVFCILPVIAKVIEKSIWITF